MPRKFQDYDYGCKQNTVKTKTNVVKAYEEDSNNTQSGLGFARLFGKS